MNKYTRGPWKRNHLTIRAESNGVHVAEISGPDRRLRGAEGREEMEYCRGNARLIAAAPDLLQALRVAYSDIQRLPGHTIDMLGRIEAAIAKAEGRS